jgi:hypothetical protein
MDTVNETAAVQPADRLRAAAALVRERRAAATPGEWTAHLLPPNEHHKHPAHWVKARHDNGDSISSQVVADCPWRQADAAWIALMNPAVGEPLAAWLESVADRLRATAHPDWQHAIEPEAFAVADAILAAVTP